MISLSLGVFLLSMSLKLYGLIDELYKNIKISSQLNRNAVFARILFVDLIKNSQGNLEILDNGHKININNTSYYVSQNNLYIKKPEDKAVELISGVKNFEVIKQVGNAVEIKLIIYCKERFYETQRVYFNNSINLNFIVEFNNTV